MRSTDAVDAALLTQLEEYYDAAPRTAADVEDWFPFTLFVKRGQGWPYYARPTLGATTFSTGDVRRVRERQRALALPEAFEWVAETTPGVHAAIEMAGLLVIDHPLLVLDDQARQAPTIPPGTEVRLVTPEDDLARVQAVASVGFGSPGTAVGDAGAAALEQTAAGYTADSVAFLRDRLRARRTVSAIALVNGLPVSTGSHQPVGGTTEIVGVATLPAYRRRGLASLVVNLLINDALRRGVHTIFLSAGDDAIARVYVRLGFRLTGTACVAEATPNDPPGE